MPDSDAGYGWKQAVRDAIQVVQVIALAWIAHLGTSNNDNTKDIKRTAVEVKEDLQEKMKKESRANEVKLYEAWRNLEWIAQDSGKPADKAKAADAKRVYDEFVAHHNGDTP